jgi:methylenetetrahydrofolate reductase (NADPH)
MVSVPPPLSDVRYEVLPFGSVESAARAAHSPLTLTVTCSPRQGMDTALDVASRLRGMGHVVVVHMAARMVRGPEHLDSLLERMAAAGIADVFLVGGDAEEPLGPYASGLDLIADLRAHPNAPRSIGVPAYPEGHPLISADALAQDLLEKARHADYMTSQLCFDPDGLVRWLAATRAAGVELPLFVGVPGAVDRRRLLEISVRVGVGASVSFIRKQRGLRRLVGRPLAATERLTAALAPLVGKELGVAGMHFFTFNRLVETTRFVDRRLAEKASHPSRWGGVNPVGATCAPPATRQESQRA